MGGVGSPSGAAAASPLIKSSVLQQSCTEQCRHRRPRFLRYMWYVCWIVKIGLPFRPVNFGWDGTLSHSFKYHHKFPPQNRRWLLQCSTLDCTAAQWLLSSAMASKVIPRYLMAHYKPLYRNNTDDTIQHQTTLTEKNWILGPTRHWQKFHATSWKTFSQSQPGVRLCLFNLSSQMTSSFPPEWGPCSFWHALRGS